MKKKEDGGPAFPYLRLDPDGAYSPFHGMTLRDYFAAKAMAALILTGSTKEGSCSIFGNDTLVGWAAESGWDSKTDIASETGEGKWTPAQLVTADAYEIADAMLEARK